MQPCFITFKGRKYRLSGSYYRRHEWSKPGPSNLHRAIWEDAYGPIPEGYEIHHVDGDVFNNRVTNLQCVHAVEHQREHALERHAAGLMAPPTDECRARAAEWHKSEDGRAWHREHAKQSWVDREWSARCCNECGREYRTAWPTRSKFCHLNCKMAALRRRRGKAVGVRPDRRKTPVLQGKRAPSQQQ